MFSGKVHNLRHFGFGHLVGENPAFADAVLVHMHHDQVRRLVVLVEKTLEHVDHEFHRRVVVIEQYDAVQRRLRRLGRSLLDNYTMLGAIRCSVLRHVKVAPSQNRSGSAARL